MGAMSEAYPPPRQRETRTVRKSVPVSESGHNVENVRPEKWEVEMRERRIVRKFKMREYLFQQDGRIKPPDHTGAIEPLRAK